MTSRTLPQDLPGLDSRWSRFVDVPDDDGKMLAWHLLDTHGGQEHPQGAPTSPEALPEAPELTLICVHGNPTWSYLWRNLLTQVQRDLGPRVRVIAVDQLEMGFSARTGRVRRLAARIDDLGRLTDALGLDGPIVVVAHDWGGPVALGWAERHRAQLAGIVLFNTAVHQPAGAPAPAVIRAARTGPVLAMVTSRTDAFIRGTTRLSGRRMPPEVARAFRAPYRERAGRAGIEAFVADIPLEPGHPTAACLDEVAAGLRALGDVPVLLLWGPGDPVFSDLYLADLRARMPHAKVHRYEGARHLPMEDAPAAIADLLMWLEVAVLSGRPMPSLRAAVPSSGRLWAGLERRAQAQPEGTCLVEMGPRGEKRRVTWAQMNELADGLARGLHARGVQPGDRVSVLIPPRADMIAVVYACWLIGASVVVTDSGLGLPGMRRALRGAHPDHVIGIPAGLALARTLRIPGQRIAARALPALARAGSSEPMPQVPDREREAVVAFTSGATGPAKGVVYRQWQVERTRDALAEHYGITDADSLVAAFAPWSLLGPTLGIPSVIPAMDVTKPRTLTARALADATHSVNGSLLWSSPAALANVIRTADRLTDAQDAALAGVRIAMFAGAPVPIASLVRARGLFANAVIRTPYGMTEALPVADVTLDEIQDAGPGDGVLVGHPIPGVELAICPLDALGRPSGVRTTQADVTGEILVRGDHIRDGYDGLWATDYRASDDGWHRTGDVGHLDAEGRLWVEGRLAHVISTADGPITPVGIEQRVQELEFVDLAAAVGIGPVGCQQVVVVVTGAPGRDVLLDSERTALVREHLLARLGIVAPVAAVLRRGQMPVDIRHNSKIERRSVSEWAAGVLAGAVR